MNVTFLGTGAGLPSKERNVASIALSLLEQKNSVWLFDCGEATQHQILHTTIRPRKIKKIFITHLHGDHIFGLPGILSSRSFQGGNDTLSVYGPPGIKKFIETTLSISETHLTYPIKIKEIEEGIILENERYIVECIELEHGVQSFGFKITEKNQPGELLVDKLKDLGIKPGPIYKKIKEQPYTKLDDGQVIYQKDVLGPEKKGRVLTIFGDTRKPNEYLSFVKGSDFLIHEATFDKNKIDLARQYFHSTTTEAATLANKANVSKLILTHISSRYRKEDIPILLKEAQTIFPNTQIASDFLTISLERKK